MRIIVWALLALSLASQQASAQERLLNGTIADSVSAGPVQGASVQVKGTTRGTTADRTGHFAIQVQPGDILTISALNYEQTDVTVSDKNTLAIILAPRVTALEQVLVTTALGIKRTRNSLPYATQQVSAAELNRTPSTNFINNLSGKVAGLQITSSNALGGSANVILRGFKSLTQSNQALFVVDGVPFDNTSQNLNGYDLGNIASDINPDDIESVTVLKGAAASALYGSRALNGVIVINTKKGGPNTRGLGITLSQGIQTGSVDKSTLPKYQSQYGQGYGSAGFNPSIPAQDGFFYYTPVVGSNGQPQKVVQTDQDQVWGAAYDPSLLVYNWNAFSPGNANYGKATPWTAAPHHESTDFFQAPLLSTTSVNIANGNDKGGFKAGYTNSYDKGILPNSQIKRNILNLGATYKLTDKLTVGGIINYVNESGLNRSSYDFRSANSVMRDFRQWWPTNINMNEQKDDYFRTRENATWNWLGGYATSAPGNLPKAAYHNNAYWTMYENYNNDSRDRYFGNINASYAITNYLSVTGRVSRDSYDQSFETRVAVGSYQTPSYSKYIGSYSETNYDLLLNFNKNISHDLNLKALLGGNVRQNINTSTYAATNGGLVLPDFYALSNSVKTPAAPTETYSKKEVDGLFGGATLTYRELITLDATLRRDQSSALPSNNNSYWYPAVSGNFVFSRLLPQYGWLSYGKLRANYAEVGGDGPVYSLQNTYVPGTPFNGQTLFNYTATNNNPNLVPETNKTYEFGIEASLLRNRISFDVTYYHSRLINQITPIAPSTASGFSNFFVNGGTVQNQGVEVSLNAVPIRTKDFSWSLALNWSKNQSRVISLFGGQPSYTIASFQNSVQLVAEVGKSYGILRGTDYEYLNGQRLIDANGYPVKATNTKSDIGNINPDWLGGITNTFTYKSFALSFLIDIKQGGDVYSLDMDYGSWSGVYAETAGNNDQGKPVRSPVSEGGGVLLQGVTAVGKANTVHVDASDINKDGSQFPFSSVNSLAAKSYVYDASYIKLRELALTYSIPGTIVDRTHFFTGVDLSLTGRNLWIIHKNLPYSDPEQSQASTTLSSSAPIVYQPNASTGYQTGAFPSVRAIAFNIKLKF